MRVCMAGPGALSCKRSYKKGWGKRMENPRTAWETKCTFSDYLVSKQKNQKRVRDVAQWKNTHLAWPRLWVQFPSQQEKKEKRGGIIYFTLYMAHGNFLRFIYFVCMNGFSCVYAGVPCVHGSHKWVLALLELKVPMVVSHHAFAGNWTRVFCNSTSAHSHLTNPANSIFNLPVLMDKAPFYKASEVIIFKITWQDQ